MNHTNIIIIEDDHYEVLDNYLRILSSNYIKIHCLIKKEFIQFYNIEGYKNVNFYFKEDFNGVQNYFNFLISLSKSNDIDILLYNTLVSIEFKVAFKSLKYIKVKNKILTIHNINSFFKINFINSKDSVNFFKNPIYEIKKYFLKIKSIPINYYKLMVVKEFDNYNVICSNMFEYLIKLTNKNVLYLPPFLFSGDKIYKSNSDKLIISIPGGIDPNRKNYDSLFNVLDSLSEKKLKNIEINFLTKKNSYFISNIQDKLEKLTVNGLVYFISDKYLTINEMSCILNKSDIIFSPINRNIDFEGTTEIYGISKSSGSFHDIVRFNKVGIFPFFIKIPNELKEFCIKYEDETELIEILDDIQKIKQLPGYYRSENDLLSLVDQLKNHFFRQLNLIS